MLKKTFLFYKSTAYLALIVLLFGCGQKGTPSGGIKDILPPKVLMSIPDSCGVNFTGNQISWKFDEYVTLSGIKKELLISPPIKKQPTYKLVGKKLTLTFDSLLEKNTTYSVFLGKGVVDLNERNPLEDNLLVFSTGEIIDSLSIHGEIYNAESMDPIIDGLVHLYKNREDSIPAKEIPSYFAKIENGHFKFTNLSEGTYKIFYLADNNSNFLYDLPNESVAFLNSEVIVSDQIDTSEIILRSFSGEEKQQFILGSRCDFKGKFYFEFNKPVQYFNIELMNNSFKKDWNILEWNENKDSLIVWSSEMELLDSVNLIIEYDGFKDTVKYDITKRKKMTSQPISCSHNFNSTKNYSQKPIELTFSQPISTFDTSKILFIGAGDSTLAPISREGKYFKLNWKLKENETYKIRILPKAVKSIFGGYNEDTLNLNIKTALNSSLGNLSIKYNFEEAGQNGILQVYFENKFQKEFLVKNTSDKFTLNGMKPGNYKLKYIADENNDKKWTAGNYWKKNQPEKVYWYNQNITLRANWDLEIEWLLTFK